MAGRETTETGKEFELLFLSDFMQYIREHKDEDEEKHYDIFIPFIDNNGIDFVIRTDNGKTYKEIQVKGRLPRKTYKFDTNLEKHENYWLILYYGTEGERYIFSKQDLIDKKGITPTNKISKKLLTEEYKERTLDDIFKR